MRRAQHREPKLRQVARTLDDRISALEFDANCFLNNERVTRSRVHTLEAFFAMPWYERVWWVLTGRCKYFRVVDTVPEADPIAAAVDAQGDSPQPVDAPVETLQ